VQDVNASLIKTGESPIKKPELKKSDIQKLNYSSKLQKTDGTF
jgi:hypothetical protein